MRPGLRLAPLLACTLLGSGCGIGAYIIGAIVATGGGGGGSDPAAPTTGASTAPVVQGVSPAAGPTSGGTLVTVTGLRFATGATVTFGTLAASGVTVVSPFIVTCTTPSYPLGPATVTVTNADTQAGSLTNGFVFQGAAPTLTSTNPTAGPLAGGTTITLTGTGFAPGATVTLGGSPATFVSVLSGTSCTAVTPAGAMGPATVTFTNLDQQAASLPGAFVYQGAVPTIATVAPATGPVAGGTLVTLTGTGFAAGATITFGGAAAGGISVASSTTITCTTPPGTFAVNVVVTNTDLQSATLVGGFAYSATAATVTGIVVTSGPIAGGTPVTLTGSNFATGATVTLGGGAATAVIVVSGTSITATTPAGTPGPANVVVTNPGASPGTLVNGFTFVGPVPTVSGVAPGAGPLAGGTTVTLTGTGFFAGATATFGGTLATSVVVVSGTSLTCVTPAGAMGPATVGVTNVDGQAGSLAAGYTFQGTAPTLAGVTPGVGPLAGGTTVTVTGSGFATGMTVTFGGSAAVSVTLQSAAQLTCVTPVGAMGPAAVVATNVDAQFATLAGGFIYQGPAPTLTSVLPGAGPMAGGTLVTLAGTNFATGAGVTFAGTAAGSVNVVTGIQITCVTPAGPLGPAAVVITNVDAQAATLASGFTFVGPAPTVTGVSPNSGPLGGGTFVTITGTNYAAGATVQFGGSLAAGVTVLSSTQITCTTPSGTGTVSCTVTNIDGSPGTLVGAFTYSGTGATVTSVSAASGTAAGGTSVTITGTNFVSGATVTFGGGSATSVVVVSATSITCTTPSGAAGPVNVAVTNPSSPPGTLVNGFTFLGPVPTLTGVAPGNGPIAGGTTITLTGTNFVAGATVTVGGGNATAIVVVSATQVTCVTPAGTLGPQPVTITNVDTQGATLAGAFNFLGPLPTLVGVSPPAGPLAGGSTVTLTGTNFASGATVTIGGAAATGVAVVSASQVTCTTPAGPIGPATAVVTNVDGQGASLPGGYTFQGPVPTLTAVAPGSGPVAGGTTVTLTGTGFAAGATVTFRGAAATSVVVVSATSITCATPASGLGPAMVTVTNVDAQAANLAAGFNFLGPTPLLVSVAPPTGPLAGGTLVTLTGSNFATGATVTFGGAAASGIVVVSASSVTCTTPAGGGPVTVVLTNVDGQSATLASGFTFVGTSPTLTSVTPGSGPAAGGTLVTLAGSNFAAGATVTFGGASATSVVVVSGAQITCVTPAGSPGFVNVVVTNPFATPGTLVNGFVFLGPIPTLTSVVPSSGPVVGGTAITLTGTGFQTGATVDLGGTPATSVVVVSATSVTATTPFHVLSVVTVTLTNPDTQSATLPAGYTFLGPVPTLSGVSPAVCPVGGGTTITCTGTNFASGATVAVDGTAASGVVFVSSSIVTAVTPAHAVGFVGVSVTNPDAQVASLGNALEYRIPPAITTTLPPSGSTDGGTVIVVYGSGFAAGATVSVRGVPATQVLVNPGGTQIRATTPAGTVGSAPVVVTNPDTLSSLQTGGFTYATAGANPTVAVLDVEPGGGPAAGGTTVTLVGTNFQTLGTTTVTFGTSAATSVVVVGATQLTCVSPAGTAGSVVHIAVVNPNGLSATALNAFAYGTAFPVFAGCVSAVPLSSTAIELRWAPALDDVSPSRRMRYAIYLSPSSGGQVFTSPPQFLTDPGVLTFAVGGLEPAKTVFVVVRARDEANNQDTNTVERSATTPAGPGGPKWSNAKGGLATGRSVHTATPLLDGRILAAGGVGGGASAEVYDPLNAAWTLAGTMGTSRTGHAGVLLPTGLVLVVGGSGLGIATSELWDPKTGTWTAGGGLLAGRTSHTCTVLANGRVLAVGGTNSGALASAEIYDPATGTWTGTAPLAAARYLHTAALLPGGKVFVAGGFDGLSTLSSAELYDPGAGTWSSAGSMATARYTHTATVVPDGRVVLFGGRSGLSVTRNVDIYDAAKAQWTVAAQSGTPRELHAAVLLPGGSVLVAGGRNLSLPVAAAELYDPVADTWSAAASLNSPGWSATLALLPDGDALFAGGATGVAQLATSEVHEAAPNSGAWHGVAPLPSVAKGFHSTTALPDGTHLVAGGRIGASYERTAAVYDRTTGTWTPTVNLLLGARSYHGATLLPSGRVLAAAGFNGNPMATAELYDPASGTWTATGGLGTARYALTTTLLRDGKVLAVGGTGTGGAIASVELYDPATGTWALTAAMPSVRTYHTATTLLNGRLLVAGGNSVGPLTTALLWDPATSAWTTTGPMGNARAAHTATLLPSGQVLVTGGNGASGTTATADLYNPGTGTWTSAGAMTNARRYHSAMLLPDGAVVSIGGFTAAGLVSVERYDPPMGTWAVTGSLTTGRGYHGTALLADGAVLVAGGLVGIPYTASAEVFDRGTGAADTWRPRIATISGSTLDPVAITFGATVAVTGQRFRGVTEAAGGGVQSSPADVPVVTLHGPIGGHGGFMESGIGGTWTLALSGNFSDTGFAFVAPSQWSAITPTGLGPGFYLLRVTVNGITSISRIIKL